MTIVQEALRAHHPELLARQGLAWRRYYGAARNGAPAATLNDMHASLVAIETERHEAENAIRVLLGFPAREQGLPTVPDHRF